jgi:hypothetical protein
MALLTNINGKFSVSDVGAVTFNNAFTFPTADGAANYVLQTNGSGQLAWALNGNGDISGSGTANTVTRFTGAKTIGNGPITFSSNDSTFAGDVQAPGIYVGATNTSFDFYNNGTSYFNGAVTVDAAFTQSGGDASTFSGTVTAPTFSGDLNGTINTVTTGTTQTAGNNSTLIATGTTQTAGNNSTLIATTAYADAAAGAVPIGNYLPLAGGTLSGPGNLTVGGTTNLSSTLTVVGVTTLANVGYLGDGLGSVQYTLQSANNGFGTIDFGDVADANIGRLSYSHVDNSFLIRTNNSTALTLDASQNATFAGTITAGRNLNLSSSDYTYIQGTHTGASDGEYLMRMFGYGDSTFYGSFDILRNDSNSGELRLRQNVNGTNTNVLSIVDGNSTFAGTVTSPTFSGDLNGTINTVTKVQHKQLVTTVR